MIWSVLAIFLVPLVLAVPLDTVGGNTTRWAVLLSGSRGFTDYAMQADICHAYQIFHRHGIPDSNIIVMMYDDLADNRMNPKKGVVINKPNGPNLYPGVLKDYTRGEVKPENFLNVLTGDSELMKGVGSGKVLRSGPNDHVFVYFSGHGSTGSIKFPYHMLYVDQLLVALKRMHHKKMYKKLVFYMDACHSGSMFANILPEDINLFATTSADPNNYAYSTYCDIPGMFVCLAGEFGSAWMEDVDYEDHVKPGLRTETLEKQFTKISKTMKKSRPCEYGDLSLGFDHVTDFLGGINNTGYLDDYTPRVNSKASISQRDVALAMLNRRIDEALNIEVKMKLERKRLDLISGRDDIDNLFSRIVTNASRSVDDKKVIESTHQPLNLEMMPCYRTLVDNFSESCVNIHENLYTLAHLHKLANLCVLHYSATDILQVFSRECTDHYRGLVNVN
ncbi:hypothetical protein J6590_060920 [Homalodisca vitripennis]|nr:hypothetical protein J6590_060920 [Homalodisca vitripennis]